MNGLFEWNLTLSNTALHPCNPSNKCSDVLLFLLSCCSLSNHPALQIPPRAFLTLKILSLLLTCRAAEIRRFQCARSCWCRSSHKKRSKSNNERVQPTVVTGISQLNPTFQVSSVESCASNQSSHFEHLVEGD